MKITQAQYEKLCAVVDRVKLDERTDNTDTYVSDMLAVVGVTIDQSDRYYADTFDADGKHYVFDALRQGDQCAGPFDTIEAAGAEAERLNNPPSYIPHIECEDSDSMVVVLDGLAGFHVDLAYVEGQAPYCSNPVQILRTGSDPDLVVCEVVKGNPTSSTWAIPLAALKTITVL